MLMMNDKRNNNLKPDADWLLLLAGHRPVPFVTKKRNNIAPAHATFFSPWMYTHEIGILQQQLVLEWKNQVGKMKSFSAYDDDVMNNEWEIIRAI